MKIGHYIPGIWTKGGVASYIRRVSEEQKRIGHEVIYFDLLASHITGNENDQTILAEDEAEVFRRCAEQQIDILHVHSVLSSSAPTVPTIRTVHGHQPYCPNGGRFLKRLGQPCNRSYNTLGCTLNHFVNHCGSVRPAALSAGFRATWQEMRTLRSIPAITVSRFLKEQMVRSGYSEEMIHVLHLPAPDMKTSTQAPQNGVPHFVFLGRITPQKGVAWLLRAAKEVRVPIHVDIAGEGYEEGEMRRMAAQLGLDEQVTFHGWINGDQVNVLLAQARALVFPSVWHEPGGTVAFEAMVNSRAVIMSRVGGMPEVISEDINGLLVDPNDVAGLANAIERLATDWSLADRLGSRGRQIAPASFSLKSHVEALMKLYSLYTVVEPATANLAQH